MYVEYCYREVFARETHTDVSKYPSPESLKLGFQRVKVHGISFEILFSDLGTRAFAHTVDIKLIS